MSESPTPETPLPTRAYTTDGLPISFYVRALYDYAATTGEEFDFREGDLIAVTDTSEDGWWRGELVDETRRRPGGRVFPSNFVSPTGMRTDEGLSILFYARALYNYAATTDEEFDFRAGDLVAVTDMPEDGWWRGELVDETRRQPGRCVFPSNFVSTPRRKPAPRSPLPTRTHTDDGRWILFYVKALYDYTATIEEEFDFRAGDVIGVTDAPEDGWWRGELMDEMRREAGREVFPSNFVNLM